MKLKLCLVFSLLMAFQLSAQITDRQEKSIPIPAEETKEKEKEPEPTTKPMIIKPDEKPSLTKINKNNIDGIVVKDPITIKKPKEEFSMFDNSGLIDPGTIYEKKWRDQRIEKDKEGRGELPMVGNQFFGEFTVKGEYANVICRDFGLEDGDLIKVLVNEEVYIAKLELTNGFKSFKIPLNVGINKVDFHALNQGSVGYNTAEFKLFDIEDALIASEAWQLPTNVKGSLVIIRAE